jgi:deoxyribodipyrimidine photo-lyase
MQSAINIFWFRRDLRLADNVGLYQALRGELSVLPIFIFDEHILNPLKDKYDPRISFIYNSLIDLNHQLKRYRTHLEIRHGDPAKIFHELLKEYKITTVFTNHDYEPYAIERDLSIEKLLKQHGVRFESYKDQVIFEKDEILTQNSDPYTVYTPYSKKWRESLSTENIAPHPSEELLKNVFKRDSGDVLSLKSIGFKKSDFSFPETKIPNSIIENYGDTRNFPGIDGTSRLGLHLRFGTVSIRKLVRVALELNDVWLSELIWREFFMMILWHFAHVVEKPFKKKYEAVPWREDPEDFKRWSQGETGYPIVDAGMRELNQTGYMHNRVRMITAGFLTKHLLIDWRLGERYFAEKLLDYELASNNGNWQWAAGCGVDAAPYFRIFNPYTQTEKFDPDHVYIKKWVPEYQSASYPKPMIDHKFARQRALDVYASALKS